MDIRKIEYREGSVVLEATVACQERGKKRPAIFIFPSWEGKGPFAEQKAVELAELGYVGCALDVYGKGILGKSREENAALMEPLMADRTLLQKRVLAYRDLIPKIPEADPLLLGAIGFCFGGLCALDLARSGADIKGVMSVHGLLHGAKEIPDVSISSKIFACHGYKDPMVSPEQVIAFSQEMCEKKVDFQVHMFGEAMHAFTNPEANDPAFGTQFHKKSSERATVLQKIFFAELFS